MSALRHFPLGAEANAEEVLSLRAEIAALTAEARELRETAVTATTSATSLHAALTEARRALMDERLRHLETLRRAEAAEAARDGLSVIVAAYETIEGAGT